MPKSEKHASETDRPGVNSGARFEVGADGSKAQRTVRLASFTANSAVGATPAKTWRLVPAEILQLFSWNGPLFSDDTFL